MKSIDQQSNDRPFLSIDEAVGYLCISKAALYQYTHKRVLSHYKLRGKLLYFLKKDLEVFIIGNQNLIETADEAAEEV